MRELLVEEEEQAAGGDGGGARPLTSRELEDVVVRACVVPVGGVPSPDQVCLSDAGLFKYASILAMVYVRIG